jgi:hypothetical protein
MTGHLNGLTSISTNTQKHCGHSSSRGRMSVRVGCSAPESMELLAFHSRVLALRLICPDIVTRST